MDESNICDRCMCTYGDGDGALCPACSRYLCYLCFGGPLTEGPPDWRPEKKCIRCEHDRAIPAHPHEGEIMSEKAGMVNEYVCPNCRGRTRTINRDEGTTPFMLKCRANVIGCGGVAQSSFYRVDQGGIPGWEWIKPTPEEFEDWIKRHKQEDNREEHQEHVDNGGMLLQKLDAVGREKYGYKIRRA